MKKEAELWIVLKDFVSGGITGITAKLTFLRQGFMAVKDTVGTLVGAFVDLLNAASEQEIAINKLTFALEKQGFQSQAVVKYLADYANALQRVTGVSDELILENMSLLLSYGIVGKQLERATEAAIDLSVKMDKDLRTVTMALGKAFQGNTMMLERWGIQIQAGAAEADKLDLALGAIERRTGGAAAAQMDTYAGKVKALKIVWEELKEAIGGILLRPTAAVLGRIGEDIKQRTDDIKGYFNALKTLVGLKPSDEGVEEFKKKKGKPSPEADEELFNLRRKAEERMEMLDFFRTEEVSAQDKQLAEELRKHGDNIRAKELLEAASHRKRLDMTRNALSQMAAFSNAKTKEIAFLAKASGIAIATMDTYRAAAGALAMPPVGPWNFALAAAFVVAGMAQVASIAGVKLAEGGMIMPAFGGVGVTMAEAGRPEVAIPLDDERTREKLAGIMGGTVININAGVIVADDYGLTKLAKKIDEKFFEMGISKQRIS